MIKKIIFTISLLFCFNSYSQVTKAQYTTQFDTYWYDTSNQAKFAGYDNYIAFSLSDCENQEMYYPVVKSNV